MKEIIHEELATTIIGAAIRVHKELGSGFLEKVYEKALMIELERVGLKSENQKEILVKYRGKPVGKYYADVLVDDLVIIEVKATKSISREHSMQLIHYLKATNKKLGLLLNFGEYQLNIKRYVN